MSKFDERYKKYQSIVQKETKSQGVPEYIAKAVIRQESNGNPNAKSPVGAGGLMQIMPATAKDLGVKDRFNPAQNIRGGVKYLKQMHDQFGSWDLALAAYNAGPGNVRKHKGIPPFKETQNYVTRVRKFAKEYKSNLAKPKKKVNRLEQLFIEKTGDTAVADSGDIIQKPSSDLSPLEQLYQNKAETNELPDLLNFDQAPQPLSQEEVGIGQDVLPPVEEAGTDFITPIATTMGPAGALLGELFKSGVDKGDISSILAGVTKGSGIDLATNKLDEATGFRQAGDELQAGAENTLRGSDLGFKSTLTSAFDTLGLDVNPQVREQVESQTNLFQDTPAVTPQDIAGQREANEAEIAQAVENNPVKNLMAQVGGFAAGPGKFFKPLQAVNATNRVAKSLKAVTIGVGEGALFEAVTNPDATADSIKRMGIAGGVASTAVKGALTVLKSGSKYAKGIIQKMLKSKNPKIAEDFLNVPEFRTATSKGNLVEKAEKVIESRSKKLDHLLKNKYKDTLVSLPEIEPSAIKQYASTLKNNSFFKDVPEADELFRLADDLDLGTAIPVAKVNDLKRIMWKLSKFKKSGDPSIATQAQSAYDMGHYLKQVIEDVIPEENILRLNKDISTAIGVRDSVQAVLDGGNSFGKSVDFMKLLATSGLGGALGGPTGALAAAGTGAALKSVPGSIGRAKILEALAKAAGLAPNDPKLLGLIPGLVKDATNQ